MVNRLLLALLVAACSSKSTPESTELPASPTLDVTRFFTADVTGAMRSDAHSSPVVSYVSSLLKPAPACWTKLAKAIRASYQLEVAGHGSYFLFEGDLPQAEVESCITSALGDILQVRVTHAGDLAVFETGPAGTAYAAWRGSVVIAGTSAQVTAALQPSDPTIAKQWRERLAMLPPGLMSMWRDDALLARLFGVPTSSYALAITRAEKTPKPFFAGQLVGQYAKPEEAALAAQRIRAGEISSAMTAPPQLAGAFKRMKVTSAATTVTIDFDSTVFEGLDLEQLQGWLGRLAAAQATP